MHGVYECGASFIAAGVQPIQNCTIFPGRAVAIQTAAPVVRDARNFPKRIGASSLFTVDALFARDVVNSAYRAPKAALLIDRAESSALVVWRVLDVAIGRSEACHRFARGIWT